MPEYNYECDSCKAILEVKQSIKDKPLVQCPLCPGTISRVILQAPMMFMQRDPKTLGHQAERNTKRMSKDELADKRANHAEQEKLARAQASKELANKHGATPVPYDPSKGLSRSTYDKIQKMTPQQRNNYIENG